MIGVTEPSNTSGPSVDWAALVGMTSGDGLGAIPVSKGPPVSSGVTVLVAVAWLVVPAPRLHAVKSTVPINVEIATDMIFIRL